MKLKCGCDPEGGGKPCEKHLATKGLSLRKTGKVAPRHSGANCSAPKYSLKAVVLEGVLNVQKDHNGVLSGTALRKNGVTNLAYLLAAIENNNGEYVRITFERV